MNHNTSPRLYYMGPAFMREAVRMQRAHATKVGWDPGGIPTYVLPTYRGLGSRRCVCVYACVSVCVRARARGTVVTI